MDLQSFIDDLRNSSKAESYYNNNNNIIRPKQSVSPNFITYDGVSILPMEEYVILRRWESPSLIKALQYNNVVRMLIYCTAVFFKYRIVNKRMIIYLDTT